MSEIVVVGSLNMDLVVTVARWPEAGETVIGGRFATMPGGKGANQAGAAAALGGHTAMIGRVGEDEFGKDLCQTLTALGVDVSRVTRTPQETSGVAIIGVDDAGENRIVVVSGANARLRPQDLEGVDWGGVKVLLLQLEIPLDTVAEAARAAHESGVTVILDPAPPRQLPAEIWSSVDIVTPNIVEAGILVGHPISSVEDACQAARSMVQRLRCAVVVKVGADGAVICQQGAVSHLGGHRVNVVDTTAAGDVFAGALAVALAEGSSLDAAVGTANLAAALSTTKPGALPSVPSRGDLAAEVEMRG